MSGKKCILCGRCRESCPVYKAVMKETAAPRAKAILMRNSKSSKLFYLCTLCGACKQNCPLGVDLEIKENRAVLVKAGVESGPNKRMIENLRKYGHPFGEVSEDAVKSAEEIKGPGAEEPAEELEEPSEELL